MIDEEIWEKAQKVLDKPISAARAGVEKRRLIENGTIKLTSTPNILVKNDEGKWVFPQIGALS